MKIENKVVHWKKKPYDVYIGAGSKWANPYVITGHENTKEEFICYSNREALRKYIDWFMKRPQLQKKATEELKGKILGDWLDWDQLSHGVFLVQFISDKTTSKIKKVEK